MKLQVIGLLLYLIASTIIGLTTITGISDGEANLWVNWKEKYGQRYLSREEQIYRKSIFSTNLLKINQHNSRLGLSYSEGLTQFADLTQQEFIEAYLHRIDQPQQQQIQKLSISSDNTIDWAQKGAVAPVRNSGAMCAGTFAWSALGAIQGASAVKYGKLTQYSWQQIIDCSGPFGNQGCQGSVSNALNFVKNKGINSESQYPFTGNPGTCKAESGSFKISNFQNFNTCQDLSTNLIKSPLSVYVDASKFAFYQSGIFNNCGQNLNLAVVLVGMSPEFWKVKLNWGTSWGEKGFIRLAPGNTCGVCSMGSSVSV